ncbi:hypothetical protein [Rubrivirga sp.]|uniref:hypothetical protein n=1 Tax=Rubrivirga sp. TaxID=1885344 RepID=UPI003C713E9E
MRLFFVTIAVLGLALEADAQREGLVQIESPLSDFLVRQANAGRLPADAATDLLPVSAWEAGRLLDSLAARVEAGTARLSRADRQLLERYQTLSPATAFGQQPPLGAYADGVSFSRSQGDGYAFELEPLLYLSAGPTQRTDLEGRDATAPAYLFDRGLRAAGHLGRLFFESRALLSQRRPAVYEYDTAQRTVPRLGFVKSLNEDEYEYFTAEGVVGYRDRFIEARFGRDRNRWGASRGTLFLSDYSAPYDHLQLRAQAGPVTYASTFARFTTPDRDARGRDVVLPSKYGAFHRFALEIGRVELEAFEAVIFHDDTMNANRRGFELGYLNPVIFYRSVESELGSGDNALIGLGASARPIDGARVYGQLLIDEFRAQDFGTDAWTNKFGALAGFHTVDLGVSGLEARGEYAWLRPHLYGHRTVSSAYVHYGDVVGHPVGPNADDVMLALDYRPTLKATAGITVARTRRGREPQADSTVGTDPTRSYELRVSNSAPQFDGVRQTEWLVEARAGYEILPRLVLEGAAVYQSVDDAETGLDRAVVGSLQLRWGLPFQSERY